MIELLFKNINGFAAFTAIIFLVIAFILKPKYKNIFALAALILLLIIESRAAILSFIIPYFFLINRNKIALIGLVLMTLISSLFLKTKSTNGRILIWKITLKQSSFTFTGNGFNSFERDYPSLQNKYFEKNTNLNEEMIADDARFAFNECLQIYYELGICGLVLLLIIITLAFFNSFKINNRIYSVIIFSVFINSLFYYSLHEAIICSIFILCLLNVIIKRLDYFNTNKLYSFLLICFFSLLPFYSFFKNITSDNKIKNIEMQLFEEDYTFLEKPIPNTNNYYDNFRLTKLFALGYLATKDTSKAVRTIENLKKSYKGYDLLLFLGGIYSQKKEYILANKNFEIACKTIPNRFEPFYLLMLNYMTEQKIDSAKIYANKILEKKIKIKSQRIDFYKIEAKKIILK